MPEGVPELHTGFFQPLAGSNHAGLCAGLPLFEIGSHNVIFMGIGSIDLGMNLNMTSPCSTYNPLLVH